MPILLYDSTFDGLLCAIAKAFKYNYEDITIKDKSLSQLSLIDKVMDIKTDPILSKKMYERIASLWGSLSIENIYKAYLYPETETLIFKYLYLLTKEKATPLETLSHVELTLLDKRIQCVSRDIHRWYGFLRFKEVKPNTFYAYYEPKFDLTNLIIPHFISRFPNQNLVIHDTLRSYAALYNQVEIVYHRLEKLNLDLLSSYENNYQEMWKEYLHHLTIKERINPKRQMAFMPKKYWPFISEMKN